MVDNERPWLNRTRREVETQAKKMLTQGMEYAVCEYDCPIFKGTRAAVIPSTAGISVDRYILIEQSKGVNKRNIF